MAEEFLNRLNKLEEKIFGISTKIRGKAGPFLLQRLIARTQTELAPQVTLLTILEGVYNLKKKGLLVPVSEKDAQRLKDQLYKKGLKDTKDDEKKGKDNF